MLSSQLLNGPFLWLSLYILFSKICNIVQCQQKFKCFCLNCLFFEFRVETIDGSANEGEDYEPLNEILTFEPNETEKEVSFL